MTDNIKVRFAPSPTGHVHIGNIRVCIYNWLFARHHKGEMLLRIEDTDRERSTPEAIGTLLDALKWLGLDYDREPVYQSRQLERHRETAAYLYDNGYAYYSDKGDAQKGRALVFRIDRDSEFRDLILGSMRKSAEDMNDMVIMKSDNTPVFHLANVVDDIDMGITHILRGNDHVENTFRHILLYEALGKEPPRYAHFPMIVNGQGKPYSKRDGDAYVGDFREKGFMPEALFNFLALCGWSPGDDREVMTKEEMTGLFTLDRVKSSPAQFNMKKMEWMNKEYLKQIPVSDFLASLKNEVGDAVDFSYYEDSRLEALVEMFRERLTTLQEFPEKTSYFFNPDYEYDEKSVDKFLRGGNGGAMLRELRSILEGASDYTEETLTPPMKTLMEKEGVGFNKIAQPLRIALTGGTVSPGIFETLTFFGKDEVLRRLDRTLNMFCRE